MDRIKKENLPSGLWDACISMETAASQSLTMQLHAFHAPFRDCYEAGVQVPTLTNDHEISLDMRLASLFLKRSLSDLRVVWIVTCMGFTSEAAAIAAALFEHALAVEALAGNEPRACELQESSSGDLPWSPIKLAKIHAQNMREEAAICGKEFTENDYERLWREVYSAYKYLCKIKHPTLRSTSHDAGSTSIRDKEFVVMAAPDLRPEDLGLKATVLMTSVSRVYQAVRRFSLNTECDRDQPYYRDYLGRMQRIVPSAIEAYKSIVKGPLPFDISDAEISSEYRALKIAQSVASSNS